MTNPGESRTLISDAEREGVVAMLREHYAAGLLSLAELTRRTELALGAVYTDEAAAALAELPGRGSPARRVCGQRDRRRVTGRLAAPSRARPVRQAGRGLGADGGAVPRSVQRRDHAGLGRSRGRQPALRAGRQVAVLAHASRVTSSQPQATTRTAVQAQNTPNPCQPDSTSPDC